MRHFDFTDETKIDCLVCHDQSGQYGKADSGYPAEATDLVLAAGSVGRPTRTNCGSCHSTGGGGNGVKHGDLDNTLNYPNETIDFHMGVLDMQCVDCHTTTDHQISGTSTSVKLIDDNPVSCTDCHNSLPHQDDRLNSHTDRVACETCHIPEYAVKDPTKLWWDWSTAGQDGLSDDPHEYLKIKGSFVYGTQRHPRVLLVRRHGRAVSLGRSDRPRGHHRSSTTRTEASTIRSPRSTRSRFIADSSRTTPSHNYFIQPNLVGDEGYWTIFDWDIALQNGADDTGFDFSGEYGFARSDMYWPLEHMVAPAG